MAKFSITIPNRIIPEILEVISKETPSTEKGSLTDEEYIQQYVVHMLRSKIKENVFNRKTLEEKLSIMEYVNASRAELEASKLQTETLVSEII